MNLVLIEPGEVQNGQVVLQGRRAKHIRAVLKKGPGDPLRAGLINQGTCEATISEASEASVTLRLGSITPCPPPRVHAVVAVPRPKALSRVVAAAASFGVQSLTFVGAWRVEKSYFSSPRLTASRLREDALLGCEQGAQVWLPTLRVARRFVPFFEDEVPKLFAKVRWKLVLHPAASATLADALRDSSQRAGDEVLLILGPEGGWIEKELDTLARVGFSPTHLGTGPLKTEVAVAAALGQLALLRNPATRATETSDHWQLPADG